MTETPESPFLRPGKVVLLTLLGLIVYFVALVFWLPAGWVWYMARDSVALPPGVVVEQVSGQLWEGAMQARVLGHSLQVGWHIDGLLDDGAYLPVGWQLRTPQSSLQGEVRLTGINAMELSANGYVDISEFSREIQRSGGAMIEGDVNVDSLSLAMADGSLAQLNGRASWPGGRVTWPMNGATQSAVLPPMRAHVDEKQGRIDLQISSAESTEPTISANIQPDGMMQIQMFKRMLDLVNQPWSGNAAPGDVVFSVRQRLMPAG